MTDIEIKQLNEKIGDAFYMLESKQFRQNFVELKSEFSKIYPNFNIGMSTSARGDFSNNWKDPYRHWCFKSKNSVFDSTLTKKAK